MVEVSAAIQRHTTLRPDNLECLVTPFTAVSTSQDRVKMGSRWGQNRLGMESRWNQGGAERQHGWHVRYATRRGCAKCRGTATSRKLSRGSQPNCNIRSSRPRILVCSRTRMLFRSRPLSPIMFDEPSKGKIICEALYVRRVLPIYCLWL